MGHLDLGTVWQRSLGGEGPAGKTRLRSSALMGRRNSTSAAVGGEGATAGGSGRKKLLRLSWMEGGSSPRFNYSSIISNKCYCSDIHEG